MRLERSSIALARHRQTLLPGHTTGCSFPLRKCQWMLIPFWDVLVDAHSQHNLPGADLGCQGSS